EYAGSQKWVQDGCSEGKSCLNLLPETCDPAPKSERWIVLSSEHFTPLETTNNIRDFFHLNIVTRTTKNLTHCLLAAMSLQCHSNQCHSNVTPMSLQCHSYDQEASFNVTHCLLAAMSLQCHS
ncbi:hypothetical protein L9F63_002743, partial [Diploptera punctata]